MATRTKSTSNIYDPAAAQAAVTAAQADLQEVTERVAAQQTALEAATEHLEEVENGARALDDAITVSTLLEAEAGVRLRQLQVAGAERKVAQAKRTMPFLADVAEILAAELETVLQVPVDVHTVAPDAPVPGAELPHVILVQSGPSKAGGSAGGRAGRVQGFHFANRHMRDLDLDDLEATLKVRQVGVAVLGGSKRTLDDGITVTQVGFDCSNAYPDTPVLGEPAPPRVKSFLRGLARDVEDLALHNGKPVEQVEADLVKIEVGDVDSEGVRTTRITADIGFSTRLYTTPEMISHAERALSWLERAQRVIPGAGRIRSAKLIHKAHDGGRIELEAISRAS